MSQPESSLDSLEAKFFSKKSAKLHFWCAHSTSLPMLAKMSSSVFRKAPCVQRAYKNTQRKKRFFGSQKRRCSPFRMHFWNVFLDFRLSPFDHFAAWLHDSTFPFPPRFMSFSETSPPMLSQDFVQDAQAGYSNGQALLRCQKRTFSWDQNSKMKTLKLNLLKQT